MRTLIILALCVVAIHSQLSGSKVVTFKAGETKSGSSPLFFDVSGSASCVVQSQGTTTLVGTLTSGWAVINGTNYTQGQSLTITAVPGKTIGATATVSGSVAGTLQNTGSFDLVANCTYDVSLDEEIPIEDFSLSTTKNISLAAGASESFSNPMFFSVSATATCNVTSSNPTTLTATITSGWAVFNGQNYSNGQSLTIQANPGQSFNLSGTAGGSAAGNIKNTGAYAVSASCDYNIGLDSSMDVSSAGIFGGNKVVTLKAGASESETNPMFFDVSGTASCVVQSTGTTTIQAGITSGWASINGTNYTSGQSLSMTVSPGQTLSASFDAGGSCAVNVKNIGTVDFVGNCTYNVGLDKEEEIVLPHKFLV